MTPEAAPAEVLGPDADTRTLRRSGVYVTGPDAEATVVALDAYSALDLSRDPATGQVTAAPLTVEQEGALGVQDRFLLRAVQGWKTDVTLETTRSDTAPDIDGVVEPATIGRYDGSRVNDTTDQVEARQVFNLRHARILEREAGASVGGSVAHEIIEAYAGARGFPGGSYDDGFTASHLGAEALDELPSRGWTAQVDFNPKSDQIVAAILIDTDNRSPGYERIVPLYVNPTQHFKLDASGTVEMDAVSGKPIIKPGPPSSLVLPPPR